jgi:hypothetical protein
MPVVSFVNVSVLPFYKKKVLSTFSGVAPSPAISYYNF